MDKARILVVDDTPDNLAILSELLSPDFRVSIALNGFEALELASSVTIPDLILLDIMMPEIDGYQVCRILKKKEDTKHIPIIFITALTEIQNEKKGLELGAVDYITKPFNPSIVLARVKTHLALYNQTRLLQNLVEERTKELKRARNEAIQANKTKSAFLANMNHELRTPLNGIVGMTQLLMTTNPTEEQLEFLECARISSARLLTMVNDLLDLSMLESEKIHLVPSDFNLKKNIQGIAEHYQQRAEEKGLQFNCEIDPGMHNFFHADFNRIRQIIVNLLNNSMQFTEEGSVHLDIAEKILSKEEVQLIFSVSDTGVGINEEQQKFIFDIFSIGEDYMTKRYGGAGLGLAISKHLVSLLGGHIWLDSGEKHDTKFSFFIPCRLAQNHDSYE